MILIATRHFDGHSGVVMDGSCRLQAALEHGCKHHSGEARFAAEERTEVLNKQRTGM
jgi:hypothetical protein